MNAIKPIRLFILIILTIITLTAMVKVKAQMDEINQKFQEAAANIRN